MSISLADAGRRNGEAAGGRQPKHSSALWTDTLVEPVEVFPAPSVAVTVICAVRGDPLTAPAMTANYLSTERDRQCAIASIKFARQLSRTSAMQEYVAQELLPGPGIQSDEELLAFARQYGATIFHPSGTCKMGDDPMAVVDERLRVRGMEGLRVVDCSIMPTLVSGNTSAPAVMIAEKASDMILEDAAHL